MSLFIRKVKELSKDNFDRTAREYLEYNMAYNETSRAHGGKYLRSLTGYRTSPT